MLIAKRFEVWLVSLNPTKGKKIKKTRPCIIISPDELSMLSTVIVAPMTSKGFALPCRIASNFNEMKGYILLDQIRTIDKVRLVKKLGEISKSEQIEMCDVLQEMFAY